MEKQKAIYIMSLEASDIFYHNHRDMKLKREYHGMIPYSLESIKLVKSSLKTTYIEKRDKYISNDIINVKFNSSAKSADDMIKIIDKKINYAKDENYISDLLKYRENLESHSSKAELSNMLWDKVSVEELRKELYLNGFTVSFVNNRTGKVKQIKYVVYKRSSAKSRTGQCLFIKESLYNKMIKWSRMGLPFRKGQVIDLASLLAYESLVGSSLEYTININPDKILIVNDVESKFKQIANVVRTDQISNKLDSFTEESEISNSLFDGESLLSHEYFPENKSMLLLRNHMFKSASFNCNIQQFLVDHKPNGIDYDKWQIENMFGEKIYAKDIEMICTPSSLKALKFSNILPTKTEKEMWNYWKEVVKTDGCVFGVCKSEKQSKIGHQEDGTPLQQTSYQMINCLPVNEMDVNELLQTEYEYLDRLKNNHDFLLEEIYKNKDVTNSNEALYELYKINKNIINTPVFKKFKRTFIYKKNNHAKKGKIKVSGDYSVLLGNPIEFLYHAIGEFNPDTFDPILKNNQVCCPLFSMDEELIGFRNPNTSPSNVLIMKNTQNDKINKYINLTGNIIVVNAINFPIQDILSGCDYDSDTMLVSNNTKLVRIGKRCFGKYNVCLNKIEGDKKKYKLTKEDHFIIDNQLSYSQKNIGRVVNLGQFCMSVYWDMINSGFSGSDVDELMRKVDVMTILSGIAIDMAKKFYDIDIDDEIKHVSNNRMLREKKKKPLFWTTVSVNLSIKDRVEFYRCPMDFLIQHLNNTDSSDRNNIKTDFEELILDFSTKNVNTVQMNNVESLIDAYISDLKNIRHNNSDEMRNMLVELESSFSYKLTKWKLKSDTIALILKKMNNTSNEKLLKVIKLLYENHWSEFKKVLKKS